MQYPSARGDGRAPVSERTRIPVRAHTDGHTPRHTGGHGQGAQAGAHTRTHTRDASAPATGIRGRAQTRHGRAYGRGKGKAGHWTRSRGGTSPRESVHPGKTGLGLGKTGLGLGKTGLGFFCARVRRFLTRRRIVARPRGEKPAEGKKTGKNGVFAAAARKRAGLHAFHALAQTRRAWLWRRGGRMPCGGAKILARARAKNRLSVWRTRELCVSLLYRKRLRRGPLLVPLHTVGARYAERLSYLNFLHAAHTAQRRKSYPKRIG